MAQSNKSIFVFLAIFLAGGAIGAIGSGYIVGGMAMGYVINLAVDRDARNIQTLVGSLRDLRAGNSEATIKSVENIVYDLVGTLDPEDPYPGISDLTSQRVDKAFRTAFEYRQTYPPDSPRVELIDQIFKRHGLD